MTSHLKGIKLNGKEIDINNITLEVISECTDSSDITNIEVEDDMTAMSLYGIRFIFKGDKLSSFLIMSSNNDYIGKVIFVDSYGNESDIQTRYDLMSMIYFDINVNIVKGRNVTPYVDICDYDNLGCKVTRNSNGFTIMYEVLNSTIIDNMLDKLKDLKRYKGRR